MTYPLAGRPVPRIGYGLRRLASRTAELGETAAIGVLHHAYDLGIRHFDTAEFYDAGLANHLLHAAFQGRRDEVVLATKAGARPITGGPAPMTAAQQPHELREAVEANLKSLGTEYLDVVNLRRMDFRPGLLASGDQSVPLEDQLAELTALRDEGKIRAIGLSHVRQDQFEAALPAGITCVQNLYYLLDRSDEPLLTACREAEVAWVPYFPLGDGGPPFNLPKVVDDPVVLAVAADLGVTATQVGLAWQLNHSPNTMLITGSADPEHLAENLAAGDLDLDPATMTRLEAVRP
jgi:pyridoxine 4-dehydrogenase